MFLCFNLANVMCAVGIYDLVVLRSGGGVVATWQTGHIPAELRAKSRSA